MQPGNDWHVTMHSFEKSEKNIFKGLMVRSGILDFLNLYFSWYKFRFGMLDLCHCCDSWG